MEVTLNNIKKVDNISDAAQQYMLILQRNGTIKSCESGKRNTRAREPWESVIEGVGLDKVLSTFYKL